MADPFGDVARSRRERRLINFVTPQLQANEQQWNRLGYGNNLVHQVPVHVR
jgi:hypothetical protein